MSRLSALSLFILSVFVLQNCSIEKSNNVPTENEGFNLLLEEFYQQGLELHPIAATEIGDSRFNNSFPDFLSEEFAAEKKVYYTEFLDRSNQFNEDDLSEQQKTSKAVLTWICQNELEEATFFADYFPIDQMWSVNLKLAQWAGGTGAQPFNTVEDYENWLERIEGFMTWLGSAEEKMKEGMEKGYVLPKSLIVKVLPQLETMAGGAPEDHLFYSPVNLMPETFSEKQKKEITESYREMVGEKLMPAYQKIYDFVSTDYLAAGRETSGIGELPNGEAFYNHRIKYNTSTDLTADEIFRLGMSEVARIRAEMESVKDEVGYEGDLNSFFNYLRKKEELMPYEEPQEVIDHFYAIQEKMEPQLEKLFNKTPRAGFEVRRTEAYRENSASAEYNLPSKDGSRPGIFYVPIPDASAYNILSDEDLFLHEAIPGHHYQCALTLENEELPKFRQTLWINAYGEGWALYTESMGKELGLYTDPYQYFGMLSAEMHRAVRLVVDVGLHAKGWTREQAIQFAMENEAEPEASIISEIERYMANPGQALGYKIGQLKILELRKKAETALGDQFDIRAFHDVVLEGGCLPLSVLESNIDSWTASQM